MKIYLKKKVIALLSISTILFIGTFILIQSLDGKNRNRVIDEEFGETLNIKGNDHMYMFNNNNEQDYDVNSTNSNSNKNSNKINTNKDNDEIKYDEEEEEKESQINQLNEKIAMLQKELNNTINSNIKQNSLLDNFAYKYLTTDIPYDNFMDLRDRAELHTILWRKAFGDGPYNSATPNLNDVVLNPDTLSDDKQILAILHKKLFPWLYVKFHSPTNLLRSFKGRGIVICTGSYHFRFAKSTVDTLRQVIKTDLPIEIFYVGESDLSMEHRRDLESFENVFCTDITEFFDNDIVFISGWAVKPYAILASRFEEVILIDADATYIRDPALWFEDKEYKKTGALFFKDRTLYPGPHRGSEWIHEWMKEPSDYAKNSRFYNELSSHEMESSTIVINKSKRLLGILLTCKFNERNIRDRVVYQNVFGDK